MTATSKEGFLIKCRAAEGGFPCLSSAGVALRAGVHSRAAGSSTKGSGDPVPTEGVTHLLAQRGGPQAAG